MTTHFDRDARLENERLASLASMSADLERKLSDARAFLEHELSEFTSHRQPVPSQGPQPSPAHPAGPVPPSGQGTPGSPACREPGPGWGGGTGRFPAGTTASPQDQQAAGPAAGGAGWAGSDGTRQIPAWETGWAADDGAAATAAGATGWAGAEGRSDWEGQEARAGQGWAGWEGRAGEDGAAKAGAGGAGWTAGEGREDGGFAQPAGRTEELLSHGRATAFHPGLSRRSKIALAAAAVAAIATIVVILLPGGGASWPASVATMQRETAAACQNPNVKSEPAQVNFACAKGTRQILWAFALLTSGGNASFVDTATGRKGLEPITPAQGGNIAWSLNLHHAYDPQDPVDSLAVAARAINNIIGGATLTGTDGSAVVEPGLESSAANCARYTGSSALTVRRGFPDMCARPVTSLSGQAALVADVFRKWITGATPAEAQDAAILFENAQNPGDPRVQAILQNLRATSTHR